MIKLTDEQFRAFIVRKHTEHERGVYRETVEKMLCLWKYMVSHPGANYEQIAQALHMSREGVSRLAWRFKVFGVHAPQFDGGYAFTVVPRPEGDERCC